MFNIYMFCIPVQEIFTSADCSTQLQYVPVLYLKYENQSTWADNYIFYLRLIWVYIHSILNFGKGHLQCSVSFISAAHLLCLLANHSVSQLVPKIACTA